MTIARRTTAVVLATLFAGLTLLPGTGGTAHADGGSGGETINVTVPHAGTVTCVNAEGTDVGTDPTLHPGDMLTCTVTGLGPNEQVDVGLDANPRALGTITTDATGRATYDFTVPADTTAGTHTLTFTGETSKLTAVFPFTVVLAGSSGGGSSGGGTSGGGSPGKLAWTGVSVLAPVTAALALIAVGTALTVTTRRRRRA